MKHAIRIIIMGRGLSFTQSCMSRVTKGGMVNGGSNQRSAPEHVALRANALSNEDLEKEKDLQSCIIIADFIKNIIPDSFSLSKQEKKIVNPKEWPTDKFLENVESLIKLLCDLDFKIKSPNNKGRGVFVGFLEEIPTWPQTQVMERACIAILEDIALHPSYSTYTNTDMCMYAICYRIAMACIKLPDKYATQKEKACIAMADFIAETEAEASASAQSEDEFEKGYALIHKSTAQSPAMTFQELNDFVKSFCDLPQESNAKKAYLIIASTVCCIREYLGKENDTLDSFCSLAKTFNIMCSKSIENSENLLLILNSCRKIADVVIDFKDKGLLKLKYTPQNLCDLVKTFTFNNTFIECLDMQKACRIIARFINDQDLINPRTYETYTYGNLCDLAEAFNKCLSVKLSGPDEEVAADHHKTLREAYGKIASYIRIKGLPAYNTNDFVRILQVFSESSETFEENILKELVPAKKLFHDASIALAKNLAL